MFKNFTKCKSLTVITIVISAIGFIACSDSTSTGSTISTSVAFDQPNEAISLNEDSFLLTTTSESLFQISALDGDIEFKGGILVDGVGLIGPVDVVSGSAVVSLNNNFLVSLDLDTGEADWEVKLGEFDGLRALPSAPVCSSTICYAVGDSQQLFAINAADGSVIWSVFLNAPDIASPAIDNRALFISGERIFVGVDFENEQRLHVYTQANGQLLTSIGFDSSVSGVPTVLGNLLVVSTLNDGLYALDFTTYELIWRAELGFVTPSRIVGDTVVVIAAARVFEDPDSPGQVVVGVNLQSGEVKWVVSNGGPSFLNPTVNDRLAFVLQPSGSLPFAAASRPIALNPIDGSTVWTRFLGDRFATVADEPLAVPGLLFFNDYTEIGVGSGFAALDSNTGDVLWVTHGTESTEIQRESNTSVLVHNGQVFRNNDFPTLPK